MRKFSYTGVALSLALLTLLASGCEPAKNDGGDATRTNMNAAPSTQQSEGGSSVTLAVLDALFTNDEAFAVELKSKLDLSDEEIARLKQSAREERESLSEGAGDSHEGSTSEAVARANEKVREIIGAEKASRLFAYASERWQGDPPPVAAATPALPNAAPTDTRIVVNIPAYRMDAFENGQLVKSYKVGIGYPEFPLPTGTRKAETIIFNPTWTPPDEPWVRGKFRPGRRVEAGSPSNPLGLIKIPIGSPSLIHGGKSPAKIGAFASHGCVGLTNAQVQDFAVILAKLGGVEITKEQVAANAKRRSQTKNAKLQNVVPVELRYETIVVEDGLLRIYRDVYDKGTNTEENLRSVLSAHGVSFDDLSEEAKAKAREALKAMARDASGKPATGATKPAPRRRAGSGPVRETKTVKGEKEIELEIEALAGKGYPAPVNLNTGGAPQPAAKKKPAPARAEERTAETNERR